MKRVLLVGGSQHGKWMDVERGAWHVRVPKPVEMPSFVTTEELLETPLPEFHEYYRIERVPIQFEGMRCVVEVGMWETLYGIERTKAIIAALFQRDIAEKFRETGWDNFV